MSSEKLPTERPEIVDPHNVPVVFVDWIVTGGVSEQMVNVTLGTIDHSMKRSDDELPRIVIGAQMRFSREFALRIHKTLAILLGLSEATDEPEQAPPTPPKNMIN